MRLSKRERFYLLTFLVLGVMLAAGLSTGAAEQPSGAFPDAIPDMSGKILTVTGPIDPSQLGPTLMHEHIFIYFTGVAPKDGYLYRTGYHRPHERITAAKDLGAYHEPVSLKNLGALRTGHLVSYDNWTLTGPRPGHRRSPAFQALGRQFHCGRDQHWTGQRSKSPQAGGQFDRSEHRDGGRLLHKESSSARHG